MSMVIGVCGGEVEVEVELWKRDGRTRSCKLLLHVGFLTFFTLHFSSDLSLRRDGFTAGARIDQGKLERNVRCVFGREDLRGPRHGQLRASPFCSVLFAYIFLEYLGGIFRLLADFWK
jgi:hypothetical protein